MPLTTKKLFIDESGIHEHPSNGWTYSVLCGVESDIDKSYCELRKEVEKQLNFIKQQKELKYTDLGTEGKILVIDQLSKYPFEYIVVYSNKDILSYTGDLFKHDKDTLRRQMALTAVLEAKARWGAIEFIIFDKLPFSKKSWRKINTTINEKFGEKTKILCIDSKLKKGLQIADLIAGSSRSFLKNSRHKDFFQGADKNLFLFQESHKKFFLEYSKKLSTTDLTYCFTYNSQKSTTPSCKNDCTL